MTHPTRPGVTRHRAALHYSISPHDQGPAKTPHAAEKQIALAVLLSVYEDCRDGAVFAQDAIDQGRIGTKRYIQPSARDWLASVAWLNGGEAAMSRDLACDLIACDPLRLRSRVAEHLGLETTAAGEIVGPYTQAQALRARSIVNAARSIVGERNGRVKAPYNESWND